MNFLNNKDAKTQSSYFAPARFCCSPKLPMKKLILSALCLCAFVVQIQAGTNAFLPFRTNDYQVPIANWWLSNAVPIENALTAIGYGPGTNTNTVFFNPALINTNLSGQVQPYALPGSIITNTIPLTNLPGGLPTLSSNLNTSLTNA